MRVRTKSACAVLALSVPLILLTVGIRGFDRHVQANTCCTSITQVTPVIAVRLAATVVKTNSPAVYVVEAGDTLSGIAARFAVPGGWPALYAANQSLLGPDPDVIQPGTVLVLPGRMATRRYIVARGDTLSGIAAVLAIPGGWPALYAANRQIIGRDPNVIQPGIVLTVPPQIASATHPEQPPRRVPSFATGRRASVPYPPQSAGSAGTRRARIPVRAKLPGATAMPRWLVSMLLGVALLAGAAFLAEPVAVLVRRRRSTSRPPQVTAGSAAQGPDSACYPAGESRIVLADYDRLVVAQYKDDDRVYVLRPPGADPMAVLQVARLVLPEHRVRELADQLGVPAGTQLPGGRYLSGACDEDLLRSDSTRAAT